MIEMASLHVLVTVGSLILLIHVDVLRFLIQGLGYSNIAVLAGAFEMIARTLAGIWVIPRIGFIGACLASPFAWILADMFLFPAYFRVIKNLEKMMKQNRNL